MGSDSAPDAPPLRGARRILPVLLPLLAVDLALIAVYVALAAGPGRAPDLWNIGLEYSVSEVFNLGKWAATAALLAHLGLGRARPGLAPLAVIYLILLADDGLQLHETAGSWLTGALAGGPWATAAQDLGELAAWAVLGVAILVLYRRAWRRASGPDRGWVAALFGAFLGLLFCGIGLDMLHSALGDGSWIVAGFLSVAEDGGEMLFASLTLALASGAAGDPRAGRRDRAAAGRTREAPLPRGALPRK
ncbi:MAG: hypothetical protein ACU0AT_04850 [Tranquillimonas sp.]|jgi:hypothetical protein